MMFGHDRNAAILGLFVVLSSWCWAPCIGRIHELVVENDSRRYISLSTFGFYKGGRLDVQLHNFVPTPHSVNSVFGFTIDRTLNDAMNTYLDRHQETCLLQEPIRKERSETALIYFTMDLIKLKMQVRCSNDWKNVHIYENKDQVPTSILQPNINVGRNLLLAKQAALLNATSMDANPCQQISLPIYAGTDKKGRPYYNTSFVMHIVSDDEEGLYNLYFYSCPNYAPSADPTLMDFDISITEENNDNFLSAGEMPLPALYCTMSILFFLSGCFWVFLLRQSKRNVFKIHYLMAVLVFLKALSLAFHGVNYHFIERLGMHLAMWAVLFYIAHLLKGALLFVILILIGTGWTFIKHVLAPRDKRLFMAVIPLQVLANVAEIILAESGEGAPEYESWRDIFVLVDLTCCGCILFPVVWSIRHLQQASATDGKAATNLRKLMLFRHFYIVIVCYIYFTRCIVYLLKLTLPFQYAWLDEMFREMSTYVFFVLTGYKFRPASHNPYFAMPLDDDAPEDEVITESGATEGLSRVNNRNQKGSGLTTGNLTEVTKEESEALLDQREDSHDYD